MRLGEGEQIEDIQVVSTGSLGLDIALGMGGLPRGRVVEIYGPELGQDHADAAGHRRDPEARRRGGLHRRRARARPAVRAKLGVNVQELLISQPDTGEQASRSPTCWCARARST
jgi:recombination protein RecA